MDAVLQQDINPRRWWILANVSLGTFMATLDGSIANVALPTISLSLDVPLHLVQWVITAYLLTISALLPVVGKISDLIGRYRVYNSGFFVFAAGSALCALSTSIWMLILTRVIQAIGASLLMANSQAIITETFPLKERGRALGMVGTVVSLGSLTGPALGGLLIGWFGWSSIFWINVPIGIAAFFVTLKILSQPKLNRTGQPFDYAGSGLFMAFIVLLLYTVSNATEWGWGSAWTISGLVISLLLMIFFYVRERSVSYPMLDFSLYKNRIFAAGTTAGLLSFVSLFCTTVMMPFYMAHILNFSPQMTGYVMASYPLTMAIAAPFSGWLSDKIGPAILTTSGLALNALGFVSLNLLSTNAGAWMVAAHLAVFGIGQGLFQSPNNASIMGAVPRNKLGTAGSLNALVRNVGMVLGISLSVSLFTYRLRAVSGSNVISTDTAAGTEHFMTALHTVFWAAAIVCVIGIFLSFMRNSRKTVAS